jgi:hypothetical protein
MHNPREEGTMSIKKNDVVFKTSGTSRIYGDVLEVDTVGDSQRRGNLTGPRQYVTVKWRESIRTEDSDELYLATRT